jgi:hypothetical protein
MNSRVRRPSAVYRLTSNVLRLTFLPHLPDLPVGLPLVSLCLGGENLCSALGGGGWALAGLDLVPERVHL